MTDSKWKWQEECEKGKESCWRGNSSLLWIQNVYFNTNLSTTHICCIQVNLVFFFSDVVLSRHRRRADHMQKVKRSTLGTDVERVLKWLGCTGVTPKRKMRNRLKLSAADCLCKAAERPITFYTPPNNKENTTLTFKWCREMTKLRKGELRCDYRATHHICQIVLRYGNRLLWLHSKYFRKPKTTPVVIVTDQYFNLLSHSKS